MSLDQWYLIPLLTFTLVLARVSGLVMTAPLLASSDIPLQIRGFLTFSIALLLTPTQLGNLAAFPTNLVDFAILFATELLLGMVLGIGVMILLAGVQITGQVISQLSGMSLADVFNPSFETEIPLISHLLYLVTMAIFTMLDGHRKLIDALLHTFETIPLGSGRLPANIAEVLVTLLSESFTLGMRAAAPAMVALLLATIMLGLISRTVPQINVMVVGFGINSLITLGMLALGMGSMVYLFQNAFDPTIQMLIDALERPMPSG